MVVRNKNYSYCWAFVVPLLILQSVGVNSFVIPSPQLTTTIPSHSGSTTSLFMSSYDADYYVPTEQPQVGEQSRITLSRFLSQYVKDHPEVSII